ncbi:STAS domain-containing protein [Comamonas endophytica]|uniref:STAS domain-containing protein n=1 Tax=Comamonas endophytica TaxID=2949090 RepID=A0ABY6GEH1_9BURK|nr:MULTISPECIES: STAS domain-containing protein [unclassified Acidovorax]MCD2512953.1 STAS domain-containing protein [Acidovorax sp. D4N7]UYG52705.1 STAS domain-containing protein [Acidovorax sp. 5MLIR]
MEAARLQLPAELTHAQARACAQALNAGIGAADQPRVDVDASALQSFDSSALAVLLGGRRAALAAGKTFAVTGLPAGLQSLAALYGVRALLEPEAGTPAH